MTFQTQKDGPQDRSFLPAAGHDWLLPFYDPFQRFLGGDRVRKLLLDNADIRSGDRILDIGCGTGTLLIWIKRRYPDAMLTGLDPDPKALTRAAKKAKKESLAIRFEQGFSDELPYEAASFDQVFSSFMFHHLKKEEKEKTVSEVVRVLKPDGLFYLLDFRRPEPSDGIIARLFPVKHFEGNSDSQILSYLQNAGFKGSRIRSSSAMFLPIALYRATLAHPMQ